jgi:hypothetical protein
MLSEPFRLIGGGVYSLPEAARLTGIPPQRIRRWIEGYTFVSSGRRRRSAPVVHSDIGRATGQLALTFSDLIEVRFLEAFLQYGVSWHSVRIAATRARELLQRPHPFSSRVFKTDGKDILTEIGRPGDVPDLLNIVSDQWEFGRVVSPLLFHGIEFNSIDEPERWWPMGRRVTVVIDPARAFGAPIAVEGGVPTRILASSAKAERSQTVAARIHDVPVRAVRHAVQYETRFLA